MQIKAIIVEDDVFVANDMKDIVEENGFEVLAVYHNAEAVLKHQETFDIAFLDVNLGSHISGIDLAEILKKKFNCHHFFITSYFDELTVLKAGKTEPLAYITKPFDEKILISNLLLAKSKIKDAQIKGEETPEHIFLKSSKSLFKLKPSEVDFIQADDIYAHIFAGKEKLHSSQNLKQLETIFEPYGLIRVHKSYLVNMEKISMIQENLICIKEHKIPVGRAYKQQLMNYLQII